MTDKALLKLLKRYLKDDCSPEEKLWVEQWYIQYTESYGIADEDLDDRLKRLDQKMIALVAGRSARPWSNYRRPVWAVAAAVVLITAIAVVFYHLSATGASKDVLAPIGPHTTLFTQDKQVISIDSVPIGTRIKGADYEVTKTTDGALVYNASSDADSTATHSVQTGIGGLIQVILPDGTLVWLNSCSKITFPVLCQKNRYLTLEGEAYFEANNKSGERAKAPFYVKTRSHTIVVLGTHFSVNTYNDHFSATLFQGKVAVRKPGEQDLIMLPSQQYSGDRAEKLHFVDDPSAMLDWKEGYFNLTNESFASLSAKLSRWYGVDFKMLTAVTEQRFYGQISRKKRISEVLNLIEQVSTLHFDVNAKTVTVQ